MQLRIGPEISEKLRYALPDEMFEDSNKGLINWFHILLYQIPAQEFLEIVGNAISEDDSKVGKATSRFEEIMREAQQMKSEFEDYKEEEGSDSDDDDDFGDGDDDLDDFLGSLGIARPK
jgi:Ran GTPase-activating protein (RanGAP) involved in mRNA processing and transport